MSFSVVDNMLHELMFKARFNLVTRTRGKFGYAVLKWPGGTKLADVLAAYDLNRLQRFEYPGDFEEPLSPILRKNFEVNSAIPENSCPRAQAPPA